MAGPNEKLDAFLEANSADTPVPEPQEAPKPEPQQPEPDKGKEPVATPEPAQEPDDDEAPREARPGEVAVPRQAYEAERTRRQSWVERAARAEAQAEELRKRVEAFEKQQQAAAQPPPQYQPEPAFQWADPQTDPATFVQQQIMNQNFHLSERMMRKEIGKEATDKLIADFRELTRADPTLIHRVRMQDDPFDWARREVERHRVLSEMGDDPTTYEQKLRAKWEAEQAAQTPQVALPQNTPPPAMPPSLAGVRSAAPRGAPAWTGPLSDQDFAREMREQRMANRR